MLRQPPRVSHGVSVFCGWASPRPDFGAVPGVMCPRLNPWEFQTDDRHMALGEYDEADPKITAQRLARWEVSGVDYVTYQIEWAHEHTQPSMMPSYRPKLPKPMTMAHCADNHSVTSPVKFCLSYWDVAAGDPLWGEMRANGWTTVHVRESWRQFANACAQYMLRPNYLHVDCKPVIMRASAELLEWYEREFGITPAETVKIWRDEIRSVTGKEPYLIATSVDPPARPNLKAWGFDALTEYLLQGNGWDNTMEVYRGWWTKDLAACRAAGLDYWIPATAGYDSTAWGSPVPLSHEPTPAQFTAHLKKARKLAMDNYDVTRGMVLSYAWNEIGEGGIVEPMTVSQLHDGDSMLRAHKEATL